MQWPAVQSSPHLQCSTSLLSGQVGRATVKTVHDANRLLKFSKENQDVGLCYERLGPIGEMQLLCFFDAAFATRNDGNSQAGYIVMLVHRDVVSGKVSEGSYHVVDWRSFKTPRVARSSLAAEAQGAGQAVDSVDLQVLALEVSSSLKPTMVTDAKALYDSYHREGAGGSLVDKRVGLEIKVVKDRLQQLDGCLKWMSSERQFADGLTKEAARGLLAERLRHGKVKLVWGPHYVAAKKKSQEERQKSLQESTSSSTMSPKRGGRKNVKVHEEIAEENTENVPENDWEILPETEEVSENFQENHSENAMMMRSDEAIEYVNALSHVERRMPYVNERRLQNDRTSVGRSWLLWLCLVWSQLRTAGSSEVSQCSAGSDQVHVHENLEMFDWILGACVLLALVGTFVLGRWSRAQNEKPTLVETGVQKDEALVPERLRALLNQEREIAKTMRQELAAAQFRAEESRQAAAETRKAMHLQEVEWQSALYQMERGKKLVRKILKEMADHRLECAHEIGAWVAVRNGECWHLRECPTMAGTPREQRKLYRACSVCIVNRPPPLREDRFFGGTLDDDIRMWLEGPD